MLVFINKSCTYKINEKQKPRSSSPSSLNANIHTLFAYLFTSFLILFMIGKTPKQVYVLLPMNAHKTPQIFGLRQQALALLDHGCPFGNGRLEIAVCSH